MDTIEALWSGICLLTILIECLRCSVPLYEDQPMAADLFENNNELTPRQIFLNALDDATHATVRSLTEVGLDQEAIWSAFSDAVALFHKSAEAVQREAGCDDFW